MHYVVNNKQKRDDTKTKKMHHRAFLITILFIQCLFLVCLCSKKQGFHMDEYYTYALANHSGGVDFNFEKGKLYSGSDIYSYLTVSPGESFQFRRVWENQAADVHPPFYYCLIHFFSSFFPGKFYPWIGLGLNIILALIGTVLIYLVLGEFMENKTERMILTTCCILMPGMGESVLLIRMYELAMVEILWILLQHIKKWGRQFSKRYLLGLFFTFTVGALTHYYVTIFIIFTAFVFGAHLIMEKRIRELIVYMLTCIASAVSSLLIFPATLDHVFHSYRGKEIQSHVVDSSDLWSRLAKFTGFLNEEMFGGMICAFLVLLAVLIAVLLLKKANLSLDGKLLLLILPAAGYFVFVAKASELQNDRYIFPVFPVCFLSVMIPIMIMTRKYRMVLLIAIMLVAGTAVFKYDFPLLYSMEAERREILAPYADSVGIVLGNGEYYRLIPSLEEFASMKYVIFADEDNMAVFAQHSFLDLNAVVWDVKENNIKQDLKVIKLFNPDWKKEKLFESTYMKVYRFEMRE